MDQNELDEQEQKYFESQGEEGPEIEEEEIEQEEEVKAEEEEKPEEPEVVPKDKYDGIHRAMDEERRKRQELNEQLESLRIQQAEERARFEERLKSYGLVEEEEPDESQVLQKQYQETQNEIQRLKEEQRQNQIVNHINTQESSFERVTPDYGKAKQHYLESRKNAYVAFGYDEQSADQAVLQEISQLVGTAMEKQVNAAEKLYEAAKANGYVPVTQKGENKLKVIESGQQQAQGIPKGFAPKGQLTAESLAEMSQAEFDAIPEDELLKVLGA